MDVRDWLIQCSLEGELIKLCSPADVVTNCDHGSLYRVPFYKYFSSLIAS